MMAPFVRQILCLEFDGPEEAETFSGWTVVDFKTDREFELFRAEYTAQVAYDAQATEKATSSSANGIMLVI
jgi:hypothetical protein